MASSSMHLHVRSDAVLSGPGHGPQTVAADAECALVASGNVGAVYVYAWRKRDVSEEKRGDVASETAAAAVEDEDEDEEEEEEGTMEGMEVVGVLPMPVNTMKSGDNRGSRGTAGSTTISDDGVAVVTSVCFVEDVRESEPTLSTSRTRTAPARIIAGNARGNIAEFTLSPSADSSGTRPFTIVSQIGAHTDGITSLSSLVLSSVDDEQNQQQQKEKRKRQRVLLVTTSLDSTSRVWLCENADESETSAEHCCSGSNDKECNSDEKSVASSSSRWAEVACFQTGTRHDLCSAAVELRHSGSTHTSCFIALGGAGGDIRLYAASLDHADASLEFRLCCRLAGHTEWIRSLSFRPQYMNAFDRGDDETDVHDKPSNGSNAIDDMSYLILASGSQDRNIRLWRIASQTDASTTTPSAGGLRSILPSYKFTVDDEQFAVRMESLLYGHEDWVYDLCWGALRVPGTSHSATTTTDGVDDDNDATRVMKSYLLSASMDHTLIFWTQSEGLWIAETSVGDSSLTNIGFYGVMWSRDGEIVFAHSYTGGFHAWKRREALSIDSNDDNNGAFNALFDVGFTSPLCWEPQLSFTGHNMKAGGPVDLCWCMNGQCLLSAGEDETTRMFVNWNGWRELARPQVHGHKLACVALVEPCTSTIRDLRGSSDDDDDDGTKCRHPVIGSALTLVSGAEEKVLRILQAPTFFIETFLAFSRDVGHRRNIDMCESILATQNGNALGAFVPAMGLTNKAVFDDDESAEGGSGADTVASQRRRPRPVHQGYEDGPDIAPLAVPAARSSPPTEDHLRGSTLWPEVGKLYGHGNEVFACASTSRHSALRLIATSCRSQTADAAGIWLWSTESWKPVGTPLKGHTLTVTDISFSRDGNCLVSVSRDRSVCVFVNTVRDCPDCGFELARRIPKAHSRIIWGCAWSPSASMFATCSRDRTVKLWTVRLLADADSSPSHASVTLTYTLPTFNSPVTSIDCSPVHLEGCCWLLAAGLESGAIHIFRCSQGVADASQDEAVPELQLVSEISGPKGHFGAVRRLRFNDVTGGAVHSSTSSSSSIQLASAGDTTVRIFSVDRSVI